MRHGSLPPKDPMIKVKCKKFGGKPPVPPIASHSLPFLHYILKVRRGLLFIPYHL